MIMSSRQGKASLDLSETWQWTVEKDQKNRKGLMELGTRRRNFDGEILVFLAKTLDRGDRWTCATKI